MFVLLGTVFVASLLGSLHCVGMCGPFALLAGSPNQTHQPNSKRRSNLLLATSAYSFGRLVTYTLVGVIFGLLGMALNNGTSFAPWQQTATYVAGGLTILVGLVALARQIGWKVRLPSIAGHLQHLLQSVFLPVTRQPPIRKAFLIGGLTCLMPCGWLYAFAIVAAGTGSPVWGAAVMIVFWSGTVPIMAALMLGVGKLGNFFQKRLPVAMAGLVIAVGIFTIAFRAPIAVGNDFTVVNQADQLIEQAGHVDQETLPCCQHELP